MTISISFSNQAKMETVPVNEKIDTTTCNVSDDELIFRELCLKYHSLKYQKMKMLQVRADLLISNERNENLCKSLLKIKTDYEVYKSHLCNRLLTLRVAFNKQKILFRKNLDDFYFKQKAFEEYCKVSPFKLELDELTKRNKRLETEWENEIDLFKLTEKQYNVLQNLIIEAFRKKVCEFCDIVLRLKTSNNI